MKYLKAKAVKRRLHEYGKQVNKQTLDAIDRRVEEYLDKVATQFNGHHARLNPTDILMRKIL